ncbi:MAG: hypothetical protein A3H71_03010 [Candidatus Sungbacteria bacterium RIFCSPLOWO2_02_FULL_48_13b]|uniref:Transcriptional repressor PaaX-like central Cas2-like domain-containing protein n=1 Tax=Candidatus Sungbacteria bacterium RIFCSPLOWO2_02_FULL_48_13b TaxID=1802283 RepID=A0A1G2LIZ1_9BACT|nr:MAG: hypothetical protein A3H71_03010 [Candidatus Sungbacteria bacterium RIFCSPLOWO2_02_FULL_48_13b]
MVKLRSHKLKLGQTQRKILLLLAAGLGLSFSYSPSHYWKLTRAVAKEWKEINRRVLRGAIKRLYDSKLIDEKYHGDGTVSLTLLSDGKKIALRYSLDNIEINKPTRWDQKWRMIIFDIPEKQKKARDALRGHLKRMGCYEFQKSAFIHPFECQQQIDFLIEFYQIRKYVRYLTIEAVDNELELKNIFHLS